MALAVPAACGGSALDPEDVLDANAAVRGNGAGSDAGSVTDPGSVLTGGDTGGTGGDTGTGGDSGTGGTGGDTGGAGGAGGGTGGDGGSDGSGGGSGGGGGTITSIKAGDCTGFKNGPGITDKTITLGNSSDISGPVPGLFTGAQQATRAYLNYFNSTSDICGRKLELNTYDSRTDAGADQQGAQKICETAFAAVGSMSAFDSGGAATAQKCGVPDIRTAAVTLARNECSICFGVQATGRGEFQNTVYDYWIKNKKPITEKAAFLYLNAGAAAENAATQISVGKKRGMNWVYTAGIDVAEFNYGPYVQQMKSKGVRFVQFLGAYQQSARLAQAMRSGGFEPDVRFYDPSIYEPGFLEQAGSAGEGVIFFVNFTPLNESQPEVDLYKKWLQQTAPGAEPTFFGLFAWSSAKLFVEKALKLGGKLTQQSLIAEIKKVHNWTGGGAHVPMDVGGKHPPGCMRLMTVKGGKFVPYGPTKFTCSGYSKA